MADIRSFFAKIPAKKASDDEQQIFTPIPNQLEPGSNRILTTTNSRTKTSRDSEDGQRKRKANTLKIGMYFLLLFYLYLCLVFVILLVRRPLEITLDSYSCLRLLFTVNKECQSGH